MLSGGRGSKMNAPKYHKNDSDRPKQSDERPNYLRQHFAEGFDGTPPEFDVRKFHAAVRSVIYDVVEKREHDNKIEQEAIRVVSIQVREVLDVKIKKDPGNAE